MNMSPYDNLPIGKNQQDKREESYDEVNFEPLKASGSSNDKTEALQYVDVPVENTPPENVDFQPQTVQTADSAISASDHDETMSDTVASVKKQQTPTSDAAEVQEASSADSDNAVEIALPDMPQSVDTAPKTLTERDTAVSRSPRRQSRDFSKLTPMDSAPQYSKLQLKNMWAADEYQLPFEETLLVPDTMPDMDSILFAECSVAPAQTSGYSYERTDQVSGEITIYTVYKPAGSSPAPVDVVKSSVSFKTDKCWENTEGDLFKVSLSVSSVSAGMLNERKFTVKGTVSIRFTEISQKSLMIFKGTDDEDLVQRESFVSATDLIFEAGETTEIQQEINIHEDQPAPLKILKESFNIIENHRQITSGKLVINGTILSTILYLGQENDDRKLCTLNNKTDFTQFIVAEDDMDSTLIRTSFIGDNLKVTIESQNQFMLQGQIISNICGYETKDIPMVSDAYHKKNEIVFDVSQQQLSSVKGTVSGEISSREVVNIDDAEKKPEVFLCGTARISDIAGLAEKGRIIIEGTVSAEILALDEDENPFVIESTVPLRGSLEMSEASEDLDVSVFASVKEFWFDSINSRQMEINAGVSLEAWAMGKETFKTIENLSFAEPENTQKHIPMAIYIVGPDDTLWDIAKRYKSDSDYLADLNELDADKPLPQGTKLFVMK